MSSTLRVGAHHLVPPMQISYASQRWDSSVHFDGLGCSQWSASDKDQKLDSKPGGGSRPPRRFLNRVRAHLREGIRSRALANEVARACLLREEKTFSRGFICYNDGAISGCLAGAGDDKWSQFSSSQDFTLSNHRESGFVCNAEISTTNLDDSLQGSVVNVNTGTAADFGRLTQMNDISRVRISQKPSAPLGWLSLGLCGNALIMRVGLDARCFHRQGLSCGLVDLGQHTSCGNTLYPPSDVKGLGWSCSRVGGKVLEFNDKEGTSLPPRKLITTKSRDDNSRGRQNKQKKGLKTTVLTRDLYERSSFHLLEVVLCSLFVNPNEAYSNLRVLSRKSLKELVSILNQTAIGLAGVGASWVLFVGSRTLWLDVSLSKHAITSLAIGFGFLMLFWAMKRVAEVLMCLADSSRSRAFQQEYITGLQKELQCIAFNAFLLVVMCFMGGG